MCSANAVACVNRGRRCVQAETCISLSYFLNTPPSPVHHPAHEQSQFSSPSRPIRRYSKVRPSACSRLPTSNAFDFLDALRPQAVFGTQSAIIPNLICEQPMFTNRKQPQPIRQSCIREAFAQVKTTNSRHFPPQTSCRIARCYSLATKEGEAVRPIHASALMLNLFSPVVERTRLCLDVLEWNLIAIHIT